MLDKPTNHTDHAGSRNPPDLMAIAPLLGQLKAIAAGDNGPARTSASTAASAPAAAAHRSGQHHPIVNERIGMRVMIEGYTVTALDN